MLRFLFCLCFVLASASDDDEFSAELELEGKKNFDFLVFSQIWPITSCDIWEARDPSNTCFLPKEIGGRWTVHGVWPSLKSGPHGPFNCDNNYPFNPSMLNPIMDKLNAQWTDVHKNARKDDFWRHEWTKHGTCAMQLEPMNNELKYFSKGLELNNKYDIVGYLSKANIVPGKGYSGKEIVQKLTSALGKKPAIECVKDSQGSEGKFLLSEVRICLDKQLNLIDCLSNPIEVCSTNEAVNFYPAMPHKKMLKTGASPSIIVGIIGVMIVLLVGGICLFFCYRRNVTRHRGYENI